jgi:hypothetical protein
VLFRLCCNFTLTFLRNAGAKEHQSLPPILRMLII